MQAHTKPSARDRLLAAADELFYAEGVHTVGIDRVIEHAGVAKATLYSAFGSKDELVAAYLNGRLDARQRRIDAKLAGVEDPRERILAIYDALGDAMRENNYRGCAFARASAEGRPGTAATQAVKTSRAWLRGLFRDLVVALGVAEPDRLAGQLVLLYDGVTNASLLDRDTEAAADARAAAATLLDAATPGDAR
jgi:AcrR family transcriptional regulator